MEDRPDLRREAQRAQYGLRSLFLQRRLKEANFDTLITQVSSLDPAAHDWTDLDSLGISPSAWEVVKNRGNSACRFFCHSDVIRADPRLIFYYRCIAGLPLKGIGKLAFGTANLERGKGQRLTDERSRRLARAINELTSAIIDSDVAFSFSDAVLLLHAAAGITFDGGWRGEIGREAARRVKELVLSYFFREELIRKVIDNAGIEFEPSEDSLKAALGFITVNGCKVVFGSEPDIEIQGPDWRAKDDIIGVVEVKGGLDEAGAQERYGAAKKTFEKALVRRASAFTLYLASVITPAVRQAIQDDRLVRSTFNLTDVLFDESERGRFLQELRWWMRL